MSDNGSARASQNEIEALRDEVRKLREEQEKQRDVKHNASNEPDKAGHKEGEDEKKDDEKPKKQHPLRKWIFIAAGAVIIIGGILWWLHSRHFENTDDAQVDAHISGLAARINGTITAVYVEENQFVKAGQVLVELDPKDYQVALKQSQSQLRQAQQEILAEQPNVPVTEVSNQTNISTSQSSVTSAQAAVVAAERNYQAALDRVREAEANAVKARADVERYRPLVEKDEVPRQQFDQVVANAKALDATVAANHETAQAALKQVDQAREQLRQANERAEETRKNAPRQVAIQEASVASRRAASETAQSQVEQAQLNLSYTKILAPVDGIIAKRMAEVGQRVAPGQQVFLISQVNDLWITANFRETQLRRMHPGQSVTIHVDAVGTDYAGYIESMPGASGSVTSLLPPENATGNFVKTVQRLPVRIRFQKNQGGLSLLRPGMSVEPKVRID